jgi:hypothetical protein
MWRTISIGTRRINEDDFTSMDVLERSACGSEMWKMVWTENTGFIGQERYTQESWEGEGILPHYLVIPR